MYRTMLSLLIGCLLLSDLSGQTAFPPANAAYRDLNSQVIANPEDRSGTLGLETSDGQSELGEGWAVAIPQFWVTPDGRDHALSTGGELPTWIQVMDPATGIEGQTGDTLIDEFSALAPDFNLTHRTVSATRHIGLNKIQRIFGDQSAVDAGVFRQAAQYIAPGMTTFNWNLLRVLGWNTSSTAAAFWGNTFHEVANNKLAVNALRLLENAAVLDAPTPSEGKDFVKSPLFHALWLSGELGVSVQFLCLRDETPEMLDAEDVAILLSDPLWVTPTSSGGSGADPFQGIGEFGLQILDSGYFILATSIITPGEALECYDENLNLIFSVALIPSAVPNVYIQPMPLLPPGILTFVLIEPEPTPGSPGDAGSSSGVL